MLFVKLKNVDGVEFDLNLHAITSSGLAAKRDTLGFDPKFEDCSFVSAGNQNYQLDKESTEKLQRGINMHRAWCDIAPISPTDSYGTVEKSTP